jgi:hypothetical protein
MNTDSDIHEREPILLTDADLDAVVGGAIVKHVDKASPKLYELC